MAAVTAAVAAVAAAAALKAREGATRRIGRKRSRRGGETRTVENEERWVDGTDVHHLALHSAALLRRRLRARLARRLFFLRFNSPFARLLIFAHAQPLSALALSRSRRRAAPGSRG